MTTDEKSKKESKEEPDRSTPSASDPSFTAWMINLFGGDERADCVVVTQVFGRTGRTIGERLVKHDFPIGKKIDHEELVGRSNWLLEQMQNEADAHHVPMKFRVSAHNPKKGAEPFASRTMVVDPKRLVMGKLNGHGHGDDSEDDEDGAPGLEDTFRKRVALGFKHAEHNVEQAIDTLGGLVNILVDRDRHKDEQIRHFMDLWIQTVKQNNDLANNAIEREMIRNREAFKLEIQRKGVEFVGGLLPGVVQKMTRGKVNLPGGRTPESMSIESVMRSLTAEERFALFGVWGKDANGRETCTKPGILTETQGRIITGILDEEISPDALDRLIQGADMITPEQQTGVVASGIDVEKLYPLFSIMKDRKEILEQAGARNGAHTPPAAQAKPTSEG